MNMTACGKITGDMEREYSKMQFQEILKEDYIDMMKLKKSLKLCRRICEDDDEQEVKNQVKRVLITTLNYAIIYND